MVLNLFNLSFSSPSIHPSIHPSPTRDPRAKAGVQVLVWEDKKKKASSPWSWCGKKLTPKKENKKRSKENVKLKGEHFLSLEALGPGSEHPWMPESFIVWQPGSAVQFYLLAGGKWSSTRSVRSERESEGSRDKERQSEWKAAFHAKTTSGVIHGHTWVLLSLFHALPSVPPSLAPVCSIFWCVLFFSLFFHLQ